MFVAICLIDLRNISPFRYCAKRFRFACFAKIGMPNKQDVSLHDCPFCLFRCFRKLKLTILSKTLPVSTISRSCCISGSFVSLRSCCMPKSSGYYVHVVSQCQLRIKVMLNNKVICMPRSCSTSCHPECECSKLSPYYGFNQNCEW